eukprot:TRINITY_DN38332_c0_g1_i2.p1 TRINITY_DN38332_c0_g1~~TRINITY_DN38332_c0_g1_i2.p1  ORF type:complete len:430 (+),score=80.85 TRINITY_DN38332_c0_g1_i2:50-1339(+)
MQPLAHQLSGRILRATPEEVFDALFRNSGSGSFEEAHRKKVGDVVRSASTWQPAPSSGEAVLSASAEGSSPPQREVRLQKPVGVAAWARRLASLPEFVDCVETWTLHGLGRGFALELRSSFASSEGAAQAVSLLESFVLVMRYRVAPRRCTSLNFGSAELGGEEAAGEVSLDAEVAVEWTTSHMFASRIEQAIVEATRRSFESKFLPLAGDWCAAKGSASAQAGGRREFSFEAEGSSSGDGGYGILSEYDGDWSSGTTSELRVEIRAASDLKTPEYRFGDLTKGMIGGKTALLSAVYVELQLGGRTVTTGCASNPDSFCSVGFDGERSLLTYSGGSQAELKLIVRDRRGWQSALRGDPLVGEGLLQLTPDISDMLPRWVDVPLQRDGSAAGTVSVRYQLVAVQGGGLAAAPAASAAGYANSLAPQDESF